MKKKKMTSSELSKLRKMRMELEAKVKRKREAQEEIQKIKELREELQPIAKTRLKKFLTEVPSVTKELSEGVKKFKKEIKAEKPTFVKKEKRRLGSLQAIRG
jgi:phosphoglycerate-specific signal transduction histidine kinase